MKKRLIGILMLASAQISAAERPRTVLVVERSVASGFQQTSIEFYSKRVVFVTNTNFWMMEAAAPRLGFFVSEKNDALAAAEAAITALDVSKTVKTGVPHRSPHATKVKIQGAEMSPDTAVYAAAQAMVLRIWRSGKWIPENGAIVRMKSAETVEVEPIGKKATKRSSKHDNCEPDGAGLIFCKISGFGYVYFNRGD